MGAAAVGIAASILGSELAQHTKRLSDAANENAALDQVIPAYDADLAAIHEAFNTGTDASDCINALMDVDTNIYNYLISQVGKAGTSWSGPSTQAIGYNINPEYHADCNKTCTAGCCVYLNDLRPAIYGRNNNGSLLNLGCIQAIENGAGTVTVPAVAAPSNKAYGNYQRSSYTLTFKKPAITSVAKTVLSVSGVNVTTVPPAAATTVGGSGLAVATSTGTPGGVSSLFTNNELLGILAVLGGIILIITALFGQDALRVQK